MSFITQGHQRRWSLERVVVMCRQAVDDGAALYVVFDKNSDVVFWNANASFNGIEQPKYAFRFDGCLEQFACSHGLQKMNIRHQFSPVMKLAHALRIRPSSRCAFDALLALMINMTEFRSLYIKSPTGNLTFHWDQIERSGAIRSKCTYTF